MTGTREAATAPTVITHDRPGIQSCVARAAYVCFVTYVSVTVTPGDARSTAPLIAPRGNPGAYSARSEKYNYCAVTRFFRS